MRHTLVTRVLHLLVAAAIVLQLASSLLMRVPRPGRSGAGIEATAFTLHEYVGLAAMAIVALFWVWLPVRRQGTSLGRLFPWFSRQHLAELGADVRLHVSCAGRLALPDPERSVALPSAIQGIGLILALVMAATGTIGYAVWAEGTAMTGLAALVFEVHGTLANVVWGYLIVHVGAALLHELLGHRILYRMSPMPDAGAGHRQVLAGQVANLGGQRQ